MIRIKDLNKETLPFAARCGEPEGYFPFGTKKRTEFLEKWLDKGILAKIAFRNDEPMGFIEYSPVEVAPLEIEGKDLMVIHCIDVREKKQGIGSALLKACLEDSREKDKKGVAVCATTWVEHMPGSFFERYGFINVTKSGSTNIYFRSFVEVEEPRWLKMNYKPKLNSSKLVVDIFHNNWCPAEYGRAETVRAVVREFRNNVILNDHDTNTREEIERFGIANGIHLNGKLSFCGRPPGVDEVRATFKEELEKIHKR